MRCFLIVSQILTACAMMINADGVENIDVRARLMDLVSLSGDAYYQQRAGLIEKHESGANWGGEVKNSPDWRVVVAARSIDFQCADKTAYDTITSAINDADFVAPAHLPPAGLLPSRVANARRLIMGYGIESFAPVAELVMAGKTRNHLALDVILETRDPLSSVVLRFTIVSQKGSFRKGAVWRTEKLLQGMPAVSLSSDDINSKFSSLVERNVKWPIKHENITLPEWHADEKTRETIINELISVSDTGDVQERALAAYLLRYDGENGIDKIENKFRKEMSAWVRACYANSIRSIGGEYSIKVLSTIKDLEKNAEVVAVIDGGNLPLPPWVGLPSETSILKRE